MDRRGFGHKPYFNESGNCLQSMKTLVVTLFAVTLAASLCSYPVFSAFLRSVTITNSGSISMIEPLHVEGRYIKSVSGATVSLRGVNKVEFADNPGATWMGQSIMDYSGWNPGNVRNELLAMKSWGINVVRTHDAIENWKYDIGSHRRMYKEFLQIAAETGMYVILDGFSVRNYWNGARQDPLPYPPYQTSINASQVIANEQEFVQWWVSVANELKTFANVLFEIWNEPVCPAGYNVTEVEASWFNVSQQVINAVRSTGCNNIIVFQWGYGVFVNLDFPPPSSAATLDWIVNANLTDPTGNLAYSTHIYRFYGGTGIYSTAQSQQIWNSSNAWDYGEIKRAFQYEKLDWVGNNLSKPLIIGELGCNLYWTGSELQHEIVAWNNTLTILNEWGLHYTAFWWRNIGEFRLLDTGPWVPPPTTSGQILKTIIGG